MRETWSTECRRAAADLQVALNKETDLATVQAVMDVIELPSRVLARFVPTDNSNTKPKRGSSSYQENTLLANAHRRAEKLVFQDKYAKAMQELTSNGLADFSMETFEILKAMHPKRKKPLVKHPTSVAQVTVSTKKAKRLLFKTGGYNNTTLDVFGWSSDFLRPVRGDKVRFIQQLARLVARFACAEVPDCVGMILSCGGLFGPNKLTNTEQQERVRLGLKTTCALSQSSLQARTEEPTGHSGHDRYEVHPEGYGCNAWTRGDGSSCTCVLGTWDTAAYDGLHQWL
jgi:hypothetical protein